MSPALFGPFGSLPSPTRGGLLLVIVGLFLGGCAPSFVGNRYNNFTAYYNKFHNAEAAFQKGLQSIEEGNRQVDRSRYVPIFLEPTGRVDESAFEKATQKSADVIREHPDSKWVDDALLLIGKSHFYQQNYVGAAQKFREAIALDRKRVEEARFWLSRTFLATRRYDEATTAIQTGIQEEEFGPWTARLYLVRGQLLARQEQWNDAAQALDRGLQGDLPNEAAARASFLLGQALETLGKPGPAETAYRRVQSYNPPYALGFAAQLSEIELQGQHGDPARALDRLRDLESDDKNVERRGEMAVVRARIHRAQEQPGKARGTLRKTLYGEESPNDAQGRLHYDLARLYRDAYEDFSRAAAHFDTASTTLGSPQGRGEEGADYQRLPTAPADVNAQANRYRDLAERAQTVARLDSLIRLGKMSDREFQAFVENLRRQRKAEQVARADRQESRQSQRFRSRGQALAKERLGEAPAAETRSSDAGFLFYKDPNRVQESRRQFEQTWGDRPLRDNWRRRVAIRSAQTASSEQEEGNGTREPSSGADRPEQRPSADASALDLSAIPRDSASLAKMEDKQAVARYKLANSLFLAAERPDSAATWYRQILKENHDHPVAQRALYALAEAHRALGDTTASRQAYRRLVEQYPTSRLAARARSRLGRSADTPEDDSSARADTAYTQAYEAWQKGAPAAALPQLLDVAVRYPNTTVAPRALLAAGVAYWQLTQADSATAPRRVLARHLQTLHASDSAGSTQNRVAPERPPPPDAPGTGPDSVRSAESDGPVPLRAVGDDSTRGTESTEQPDSTGEKFASERPDTTQVSSSVTQTSAPDTTQQRASDRSAPDVYAPLAGLMTYLTSRYSDAPQEKRARSILDLIDEQRADTGPALADTTAASPSSDTTTSAPTAADTTVADTARTAAKPDPRDAPDTTRAAPSKRIADPEPKAEETETEETNAGETNAGETNAGETNAGDDSEPLPAPPDARTSGEGARDPAEQGIDRSEGGWTLLLQTFSRSQDASPRVEDVDRRLGDQWPVDVLKGTQDGETQYHLVVGQFASERAAVQAQKRVATQLPSRPEVWALSDANEGS